MILHPIPLPSSTLFLTREEAVTLLSSLEEILPHSDHFEIAGEILSGEEMQGLREELMAVIWMWKSKK